MQPSRALEGPGEVPVAVSASTWFTLVGIVLLALGLRLQGIAFGLPQIGARPDEQGVIWQALMIAEEGSPQFFAYPSLYPLFLSAAITVRRVAGILTGETSIADRVLVEFALAPEHFHLLDRVLVALFGSATVVLVFLVARRVGARNSVGYLAAFFTAVAYLHVRESHFGTVDIPLTFFCVFAVLNILRAADHASLSRFAMAGLCAGLATSTKYNAVALIGPLILAALLKIHDEGRHPVFGALVDRRLWVAGAAVLIGFLAGTPFLLWNWGTFVSDVTYELTSKLGGGPFYGIDLGRGWYYHLRFSLWHGCGPVLLLLSLVGVIKSLHGSESRAALLALAFPLFWWFGVGASRTVFVRYAVPLVPFVCVFAAVGLSKVSRRLSRSFGPGAAGVFGVTVLLLAVALPLHNSVRFAALLKETDNRVLAVNWLDAHLPDGARVGQEWGLGAVRLWPTAELMDAVGPTGAGRFLAPRIGPLRVPGVRGYVPLYYDAGSWWVEGTEEVTDSLPDAVILRSYPLAYEPADPGLRQVVEERYQLTVAFEALPPGSRYAFDKQDAFYLPYARFGAVRRPGPNLEIWLLPSVIDGSDSRP